jgi:hypothetical protein
MWRSARVVLLSILTSGLVACGGSIGDDARQVDASGKQELALGDVPTEVRAAASAAQPELTISEAEYETRDGNEYYDVGGLLPDGSELELDMTRIDGVIVYEFFGTDYAGEATKIEVKWADDHAELLVDEGLH